jgi:hypothetical protein
VGTRRNSLRGTGTDNVAHCSWLTPAHCEISIGGRFDTGHARFFGNSSCAGWGPTHHNPTNCTHADEQCTCSHGYATGAVEKHGNDVHAVSTLYANITAAIADFLIPAGVSANLYTQTSDVETEADGIMSYDRVLKVSPAVVLAANQNLKRAAKVFFATLDM